MRQSAPTAPKTAAAIQDAKHAGLIYSQGDRPGYARKRRGKGFTYLDLKGRPIKNAQTLARIRSLAIPPAYRNVWICAQSKGHLQVVAEDARGRKQYRYHPDWTHFRGNQKYDRILQFGKALPLIREATSADLRRRGLPREKVLATIVKLLEKTLIRVGNDEYARDNHSYGLSTFKNHHVAIQGGKIRFHFKGKSNIRHDVQVADARLAQIVRECRDIEGQDLFQYLDAEGEHHLIRSQDVNGYLREVGGEAFTAKDFRTWAGTVHAAVELRELKGFESAAEAKRRLKKALIAVSEKLGNTPGICRKCYVHPAVMESYLAGEVIPRSRLKSSPGSGSASELTPDERNVLKFLRAQI